MFETSSRPVTVAGLAIALLTLPLAGCISADDTPTFESYAEAQQADGVVLEPLETETTIRLKTLHPADPLADTGVEETELVFLLFDSETDEPVTNAQFSLDVHKAHDDHVSPTVQTPTHVGNGVYEGLAAFDKPEGWVVDLTITIPGGETLAYPLHYHAGETDHTHEDYFHTEEHQHEDEHDHDHEH